MSRENTYWGILCRTCSAPVAFGAPSHQQFQLESIYARPGAIRCPGGHNHIYFPRDFNFFVSAEVIPEEVMEGNREGHRAINPAVSAPTDHSHGKRLRPKVAHEADSSAGEPKAVKQASSGYGPDPRREMAQAAAKDRWAAWAINKAL